jgi:pimeloyl-ACP methyl ester carboxylesterase
MHRDDSPSDPACHFQTSAQANKILTPHRLSDKMSEIALLFSHGIGHCKEVWTPVIKRIQDEMGSRAVECASFSFHLHGERADPTATPVSVSDDPKNPRLYHPAVSDYAKLVETVMAEVHRLREANPTRPIIGVGHSMGAVSLWLTEIAHPGTFARLVLFEPVYNFSGPIREAVTSFLVASTLQQRSTWSSRANALAYLKTTRVFSMWHPEALEAFVNGSGLKDNDDGSVSLSVSPAMEAAFLSFDPVKFTLEELETPRCRIIFHGMKRSKMFMRKTFEELSQKWPTIYSMAPMIPDASHLVNVEDPEQVAIRVVEELEEFESMQEDQRRKKREMSVARL